MRDTLREASLWDCVIIYIQSIVHVQYIDFDCLILGEWETTTIILALTYKNMYECISKLMKIVMYSTYIQYKKNTFQWCFRRIVYVINLPPIVVLPFGVST